MDGGQVIKQKKILDWYQPELGAGYRSLSLSLSRSPPAPSPTRPLACSAVPHPAACPSLPPARLSHLLSRLLARSLPTARLLTSRLTAYSPPSAHLSSPLLPSAHLPPACSLTSRCPPPSLPPAWSLLTSLELHANCSLNCPLQQFVLVSSSIGALLSRCGAVLSLGFEQAQTQLPGWTHTCDWLRCFGPATLFLRRGGVMATLPPPPPLRPPQEAWVGGTSLCGIKPTWWRIWEERNNRVFRSTFFLSEFVAQLVQEDVHFVIQLRRRLLSATER
ncbi:uncharacterized protein LOC126410025 [Nymphaea colorata]|uniref:uncharacterized protein LOC126410025 n=1 Tax=Nymphaea colorata TaxID=210225 RepID=UPI00214F21BA|nr:uncharacterized protein LOC126410025 [Nymphaea colorata]